MSLQNIGYEPTQNENNTELYKIKVIDGEKYDENTFISPKGVQYNLPNHPEEMAKTIEKINAAIRVTAEKEGKIAKEIKSIKEPVMIRLTVKVLSKADGSPSDIDDVCIKTNPIQFDFKPRRGGYKTELALLLEGAGNNIEELMEKGFNLQSVLLEKEVNNVPIITATVEGEEVSWLSFKDWRKNQGWVSKAKPEDDAKGSDVFGSSTEANKAAKEFDDFINTGASDDQFN